jgi:hypothetical protein
MKLNRVVQVFFVLLIIIALGGMVWQGAFSYFLVIPINEGAGGWLKVHNLTVVLSSATFLFFWLKVLRKTPFLPRLLLTVVFVIIGYTIYDQFWGSGLIVTYLHDIPTPLGFDIHVDFNSTVSRGLVERCVWLGFPIVTLALFKKWRSRYLPRISAKRFALVLALNTLLIAWLYVSGFYEDFLVGAILNSMGYSMPDAHGWVWFIGKALGMLSFPAIFVNFHEVKAKLRRRFHV